VMDNVNAYKVEGHRHTAELEQELPGVHFSFVAHLLPIDQGILASCYAIPSEPLGPDEAQALFEAAYGGEPFVEVLRSPPRTRDVRDTNRALVQVAVVNDRVLAFCAIDNLWKGAASQAVQNLNLMFGLDESLGLPA
jgi:N-acetyl-gamma-glutamyl-phosphate reductase